MALTENARCGGCLLVAAMLVASGSLRAAETAYPTKPIRLVIGFPPGGGSDALGHIMRPGLTQGLGQQIVIDNRPGATGNIAAEIVVRAAPDGHTLLMGFATTLTVNPSLYKLPFDVKKDLVPISQLANTLYFLVLHPSVPAKSVKEFIALAKEQPGKLNYASSGVGAPLHLAAELFKQRTGIDIVHIPYKGGGPAGLAVLSGEAQVLFGSAASTLPFVKAGRLNALAVTSGKRYSLMPELPTIEESGFPGFRVTAWDSILAPAGTPQPIINRIHTELVKLLNRSDIRNAFLSVGYEVTATTGQELAAIIKADTAMFAKVIKDANIRITE